LHRPPPPDPEAVTPSCPPHESEANRKPERKRKRSQEVEASQSPSEKRLRADINDNRSNRGVETWLQKGSYPEDYFEPGNTTWEDIKADTSRRLGTNEMNNLLARKKSAASLHRQALEANTPTPTEKIEDKSLPYRSPGYERELKNRGGSYLDEANEGITEDSKTLCQTLLTTIQAVPQDSLFRDDLFDITCRKLRNRNESRTVEDVSPLIAPSAETLAAYGATELDHLVFNINERWNESLPITDTRPQPDRCVGFSESAFTGDQLQKLKPYIGSLVPVNYLSVFLATWRMYFPFFACEAKCGIGDIDVADKQNAHSMTMAVRGIVKLFELAGRRQELDREILAFSISHDARYARIYGYYALTKDDTTTFYRHPIRSFDFTEQNGINKWTAYRFTKNVYFEFMPKLHKLICSAIDKISPDTASQGSKLPPKIPLGDSFGTDLESEQSNSQEMAASAPASQDTTGSKKRKVTKGMLEQENEQYKGQVYQLLGQVNLLKQQPPPNANPGNDSEALRVLREELERQRQENERQRQESKQEINALMDLLKQALPIQTNQMLQKI